MPKANEFGYDFQKAIDLYSTGLSSNEVSLLTGIPRHAVTRYVRRAGVKRKYRKSEIRKSSNGELEKFCTKCRTFKPATYEFFHPKKGGYNGLDSQCKTCTQKYTSEKRKRNSKKLKIENKKYRDKERLAVLSYYSNGALCCACCKVKNIEFLAIDHINGNGNTHRKEVKKTGGTFFRWLIKNNYPEGFRVLCHNCNFAMWHLGFCPHQVHGET